ncbi:MAG: radical SAM/SPASM domain-containing protein [Clostridium sp.]
MKEVDLYVTDNCNLKCKFCSVMANKNHIEDMSLKQIKDIIDQLKELKVEELHITGGEPFLRKDLEEIVEYAIYKGFNVRVITNGTYTNSARLKKLYSVGLRNIMFSLDGEKEYHDSIRGVGMYDKTVSMIKVAQEMGYIVRVNSVAWKNNCDSICENLKKFNVDYYSIFLGSPLGSGNEFKEQVVEPKEWRKFRDKLKDIMKKENIKTEVILEVGYVFRDELSKENRKMLSNDIGCTKFNHNEDFFLIKASGEVYPCVFFSNDSESLGNVKDSTMKEILDKYRGSEFYSQCGKCTSECNDCLSIELCQGGCKGYSKIYFNNWFKKDPRCDNKDMYYPVCPITKINLNTDMIGPSTEDVV